MARIIHQVSNQNARRAFFIDSENGVETLLQGYSKLHATDLVVIFHRNNVTDKIVDQLNRCQAQVDWIECIDPKIKNSLDFQLIVELSLRLTQRIYKEAYIVSKDKGFSVAAHYLQRQPLAQDCSIEVIEDINRGLYLSLEKGLLKLESAKTEDEVQAIFGELISKRKASCIVSNLSNIFKPDLKDIITEMKSVTYELSNNSARVTKLKRTSLARGIIAKLLESLESRRYAA